MPILCQQNERFKISGYHGPETRLNIETNGYLAYFEAFFVIESKTGTFDVLLFG